MKTNLKISLVAGLLLVAGLAYSQSPMGPMGGAQCDMMGGGMQGHGMSHRGMGKMDPAKMQAMMDKRHAALKAQLKITASQEAAWTSFIDAHKAPAGMMGKQPAAMADMAKLTTPERIDKMKEMRTQHMGEMNAAMDKRSEATKAFYAVLTPEQQKTFDAHSMMGQGRGHGARGGKGPMQPMPPAK
ncbi:MAG: Spy/CpxP family protein refolding chaperone [Rhodoferax sp.]|uniref:Spy/CpxP family protein refolding chaperone n=1 Tax=Rhodoferax sp. TaxID=50421 RepID=UPI002632C0FA|nr:Spy/CpxP family protein refolding chaperone [Rhodoferax sp.]MDD2881636.1 Spy/CpxP family protein refolding chaperone [Rhodoferax sp.]